MESNDLAHMREQIERDLGLSIAEVVELTKRRPNVSDSIG
jgi:hypothetical protein